MTTHGTPVRCPWCAKSGDLDKWSYYCALQPVCNFCTAVEACSTVECSLASMVQLHRKMKNRCVQSATLSSGHCCWVVRIWPCQPQRMSWLPDRDFRSAHSSRCGPSYLQQETWLALLQMSHQVSVTTPARVCSQGSIKVPSRPRTTMHSAPWPATSRLLLLVHIILIIAASEARRIQRPASYAVQSSMPEIEDAQYNCMRETVKAHKRILQGKPRG
jgi:hypothetical protein